MYKFLLRRKIKNIIKDTKREKVYYTLKEIKTVLILFDTKNLEDVSPFIQELKRMGKKIKLIAFKSKKKDNISSDLHCTVITDKDKIQSLTQIANVLSDETFDLAIDFTPEENVMLLYILVSINSPMKTGIYKHPLLVHDVVIAFPRSQIRSVEESGKQLLHYLTIISSGTENP